MADVRASSIEVDGVTLDAAMSRVRADPANVTSRVGLARLFALAGQWDRVAAQLRTIAELDAGSALFSQAFSACARCERLRADVFAGRRTPLVIGEPPAWLALLVQALQAPDDAARRPLVERALDEAPAVTGQLDDEPFAWIADGDARLGPVLEAFVDGKYYWIPLDRVERVRFEAPADLFDAVWQSCEIVLATGVSQSGFMPTRYPGSEAASDQALALGRATEWRLLSDAHSTGLGGRVFITDGGEHPQLACRELVLHRPS